MFDILIIGGNSIGLSAALASAQLGFRVAVIEALVSPSLMWNTKDEIDGRVFAINRASEQLLTDLGVWSGIESRRCTAYQKMAVWDRESSGHFLLNANCVGQPNLGTIIEQSVLFSALRERCKDFNGIEIFEGEKPIQLEVLSDKVQVTLASGKVLGGALLLGADGVHSWVRHILKMPVVREEYGQEALVGTFLSERSHEQTAYQWFSTKGPLALLPVQDKVSMVWSVSSSESERLQRLSPAEFEKAATIHSDAWLGRLKLVSKISAFPLVSQHAKTYVQTRVALLGDAAHAIHPLAGQGMNLGFADIQALIDALKEGMHRRRVLGTLSVLKHYERSRLPKNLQMMAAMKAFSYGFSSAVPGVSSVRKLGMSLVDKTPFLQRWVIHQALGI